MRMISLLDFRLHAEAVIRQVQSGQRLILTRRGKPVMRLEPIMAETISEDDPVYGLADLATDKGESLTNEQIDETLYK